MSAEQCYSGPIYTNVKCIIISMLLAGGYWFAPHRNKWVLLSILYFTYLAIAWYDELLCSKPFGPTYLKWFYEWGKPKDSFQSKMYSNLCPSIESKILTVDIIILIIILISLPTFIRWNPK
jgi:hypothetical protein